MLILLHNSGDFSCRDNVVLLTEKECMSFCCTLLNNMQEKTLFYE